MKKFAIWFLLALALVPLAVTSDTLYPTANIKALIYRGVAFVVTGTALMLLLDKREGNDFFHRLQVVVHTRLFQVMTASTVALGVSTLFAHNTYLAFFGTASRNEGFLTLFALYVLYVWMSVFFDTKNWQRFFVLFSFSGLITFFYSVYQIIEGVDRPHSFIGNPIPLAAFFIFTFFAGIYVKSIDSKKMSLQLLAWATMIASIVGIFLTKTRGTILAVLAATIMTGVLAATIGTKKKIKRYAVGSVLGVCVLIGIFLTTQQHPLWQKIPGVGRFAQSSISGATIQSRILYNNITINGFLESTPLQKTIGWGWDNYESFWQKNYDPKVYQYDRGIADRAHNKLGDMLIMTGILGLLLYVMLWSNLVQVIFSFKEKGLLFFGVVFTFVAYFVQNLFSFDIGVVLISFYVMIAWLTAQKTYEV